MLSFSSLGQISKRLLRCMISIYLILVQGAKLFSKVVVEFYIPTNYESFSCCAFLLALGITRFFFNLSILIGMWLSLIVAYTCVFLKTNVLCIFNAYLLSYYFFGRVCAQIFCSVLELFVFLLMSSESSLCILETHFLADVCLQRFSPSSLS